jgi:hypothetical protein
MENAQNNITIGQPVNHNRMGAGIVTAITGENLSIEFANGEVKTFVTKFVMPMLGIAAPAAPAKKDWSKANAAAKAKREKAAADYADYKATRTEEQRIADELTSWGASQYKDGSLMTEREGILHEVSMQTGFAADVAKTCLKYGKVSQKQAAIIAKAYLAK